MRNYYEILGVSNDADADQIKAAYYRLAREYNPALHPGDPNYEQLFADIEEAYETLIDPDIREAYDVELYIGYEEERDRLANERYEEIEDKNNWTVIIAVLITCLHLFFMLSECNKPSPNEINGGVSFYPSMDSFMRSSRNDSMKASTGLWLMDSISQPHIDSVK